MMDLSLHEAQLFRICSSFFGQDRVLLKMGVLTVCGGGLPHDLSLSGVDAAKWAKENSCLITIVNADDQPRLVIEFFSGYESGIDMVELEHQRYLKPILKACSIQYLTISLAEFDEILDPESSLDFVSWLKSNMDLDIADEGEDV